MKQFIKEIAINFYKDCIKEENRNLKGVIFILCGCTLIFKLIEGIIYSL
jgi:hypothetical protein